ncbi:MAG: glycosyltransferase family 4 protein [Candidatus Cloacimonetes bacterium]|nr:glycosyltransferase family 4 protein [Candidatus Cloacimonadota bacterium]
MNKTKALLVLPSQSTFSELDRELLSRLCDLDCVYLEQNSSRKTYLVRMIAMLGRILCGGHSLIIVWFADYHAAMAIGAAKLLGKKSLVFIGGYDAVCYPELGMGVYCNAIRSLCASFALRNCSLIVANHESLLRSNNLYYRQQGHPDGVYNLIPALKTPARVIYNALSIPAPDPEELSKPRVDRFLCVGTTPRYEDTINKGYDLIAQAARLNPDRQFVIVGIADRWQARFSRQHGLETCPNLKIHSYLPHGEVLELMRTSRCFIQASISEGMPNALMEAMAMGCIPIGSRVAAIPTLIGEVGIIVEHRDLACLNAAISESSNLTISPTLISKRIVDVYSQDKRYKELKAAIMEI